MSEFTRAQIRALIHRAQDLIQRSQDIRRQLEDVMLRIEKTGVAREPDAGRVPAKKRKALK